MSLLEKALQEGNYELAALAIVYGMLKVIHNGKEADRCPPGATRTSASTGFTAGFLTKPRSFSLTRPAKLKALMRKPLSRWE